MKKDKIRHWVYRILRSGMLLFWLYVGMDKIWIHGAFQLSLAQQPLIGPFPPILSWLMPAAEISLGILLFMPGKKLERLGWLLSITLIVMFSIYIALGIAGVLKNAPCMCSSFLTNINRTTHLWINGLLFVISFIGLWLSYRTGPIHAPDRSDQQDSKRYRTKVSLFLLFLTVLSIGTVQVLQKGRSQNAIHYPMQDAPFPGRPVDRATVAPAALYA